ncbi:hypothetical protein C8R44DRAFT_254160 [Mycena epipterygia]|nr:hypothetical protein C8R44DRAFT_254160 [Mycena epipterygia]
MPHAVVPIYSRLTPLRFNPVPSRTRLKTMDHINCLPTRSVRVGAICGHLILRGSREAWWEVGASSAFRWVVCARGMRYFWDDSALLFKRERGGSLRARTSLSGRCHYRGLNRELTFPRRYNNPRPIETRLGRGLSYTLPVNIPIIALNNRGRVIVRSPASADARHANAHAVPSIPSFVRTWLCASDFERGSIRTVHPAARAASSETTHPRGSRASVYLLRTPMVSRADLSYFRAHPRPRYP